MLAPQPAHTVEPKRRGTPGAWVALAAACLASAPARVEASPGAAAAEAGAPASPSPRTPAAEPTEVRAALSAKAAAGLRGQRVLRLLDIELDEHTPLAAQPAGPLGSDVIWVWIDMPSTDLALIEVRGFEHSVARRTLAVTGLGPEVAARVVAIAASEMVRAQARAGRTKESPKPAPGPTSDEASRAHLLAGITYYGPEFGLPHRSGPGGQQIYGRWLVNAAREDLVRWLEVGAGADLRLPLPSPDWRLHFGARASAVNARLGSALGEQGDSAGPQEWTAAAAAVLGVEARLAGPTWLELAGAGEDLFLVVDGGHRRSGPPPRAEPGL